MENRKEKEIENKQKLLRGQTNKVSQRIDYIQESDKTKDMIENHETFTFIYMLVVDSIYCKEEIMYCIPGQPVLCRIKFSTLAYQQLPDKKSHEVTAFYHAFKNMTVKK